MIIYSLSRKCILSLANLEVTSVLHKFLCKKNMKWTHFMLLHFYSLSYLHMKFHRQNQFSCLCTKCLKFLKLKDSSSLSFKCWKQFPTVNTFAMDDVRKNFNNGGRQWIQFALGSFSKSVTPLSTHSLLDSSLFLSLFFFESKRFQLSRTEMWSVWSFVVWFT